MRIKKISYVMDLDVLRNSGFQLEFTANSNFEQGLMTLTTEVVEVPCFEEQLTADLERTLGVKKTEKLQEKAAKSIQHAVLMRAFKDAMK